MRHFLFLIFTLLLAVPVIRGEVATITGTVINVQTGQGEPYASVRVFAAADSLQASPVAVTVATDAGLFSVDVQGDSTYTVTATAVGLTPVSRSVEAPSSGSVNLGTIELDATQKLKEVTVEAARPVVVKEIDRIGYDVEADPAAAGEMVSETLRKVPLVTVDPDGTIKLNGNTSFKVYRNGRRNQAMTLSAKELFRSLPSSSIKRIEVITDPGVREDAEGENPMILNIVMRDEVLIKGVAGTASLNMSRKNYFIPQPYANLTSQIGKVTIQPYVSFNHSVPHSTRSYSEMEGRYTQTGDLRKATSFSDYRLRSIWTGVSASWEPDTLNLFTFDVTYYNANNHTDTHEQENVVSALCEPVSSYDVYHNIPRELRDMVDVSAAWQRSTRRKGENITLSYQMSMNWTDFNNRRSFTSEGVPTELLFATSVTGHNTNMENTVQLDWTRPFGDNHTLDVGAKYINRNIKSRVTQEYDIEANNSMSYYQHLGQVAAVYADYRGKGGKWQWRAGARYEFSRLESRFLDGSNPDYHSNLSDVVPSLGLGYRINPKNTLNLSFSTYIYRPGISFLNPVTYVSPVSTTKGNPELGSANYRTAFLTYTLMLQKFYLQGNVIYQFLRDGIGQDRWFDGNHLYLSYGNTLHSDRAGVALWAQWTPSAKTQFTVNAQGLYTNVKNTAYDVSKDGWSFMMFFTYRQELPWGLTLSPQLVYFKDGPTDTPFSYTTSANDAKWGYSVSLYKSFLKDKRLTVSIDWQNPFLRDTWGEVNNSINSDYLGFTRNWTYGRHNISLSLQFRFGKLNAQVKRAAHSISNDDIQGRK